jgi:hypothetical protein
LRHTLSSIHLIPKKEHYSKADTALFYLNVPNDTYVSIAAGRSMMIVEVASTYSGGQAQLRYLERFRGQ